MSAIVVGPDGSVQLIAPDGGSDKRNPEFPKTRKSGNRSKRTRPARDVATCPRDSPLDTLVRGVAEFHMGPLLDAIEAESRPAVSPGELVRRHMNQQFERLQEKLGDE